MSGGYMDGDDAFHPATMEDDVIYIGTRKYVAADRASQAAPAQPTEAMLNAARDWSDAKYGKPIGNDAAIGCWNAMLAAAPAPSDGLREAVVKPLEWEWVCEYGCIARAATSIGTYSLHSDEDSAAGRLLLYLHLTQDGDCTRYAIEVSADYLDPDEMKEVAQDDYASRIRAALTPAPAQEGGE